MSRRQHNRQRLSIAATAAMAADDWIGWPQRARVLAETFGSGAVSEALERRLLETPRLRRRLPSLVPRLLKLFSDRPELAPWFMSPDEVFALARMAGAVSHGASLARMVDGASIVRLSEYLGPGVWRFGVEHALDQEPDALTNDALAARILDTGLVAVRGLIEQSLPDLMPDIAETAGLDWTHLPPSIDPARDAAALQRVLTYARPT